MTGTFWTCRRMKEKSSTVATSDIVVVVPALAGVFQHWAVAVEDRFHWAVECRRDMGLDQSDRMVADQKAYTTSRSKALIGIKWRGAGVVRCRRK